LKRIGERRPVPHLSFEAGDRLVLDEVDARLLRRISETGSLTEASRQLGISYRNAWGRIKRVESITGTKILDSSSGGAAGGGSKLTPEGLALFKEFRRTRKYLFNALDDRESAGNVRYKLSARNLVEAKVTEVERGDITSLIRMVSRAPVRLTSIISNEAVDDLGLSEGDEVEAVIKSTEVMVAKSLPPAPADKSKPNQRNRPAKGLTAARNGSNG
jgi:molybdate transport system regulatory protein